VPRAPNPLHCTKFNQETNIEIILVSLVGRQGLWVSVLISLQRALRSKCSAIEIIFPSVCLSVCNTGVLCVNRGLFENLFKPDGRPENWLDCKRNSAKMFATVSTKGFVEGGMKNHDFRPISSFISETIQDRALVIMEDK